MTPLPLILLLTACHSEVWEDTGPEDSPGPTTTPDIVLEPAQVAFGEVDLEGAECPSQAVVVRNVGDGALHILSVTLDNPMSVFSVSTPAYLVVEPGGSTSMDVVFAPLQAFSYQGAMIVSSDDPDEPEAEVPLTGVGRGGEITATPDPVVFTSVLVGCTAQTAVTLANTGGGTLTIASFGLPSTGDEMAVAVAPDLPATVAPGESIDVRLSYAPHDTTPDSAVLQVFGQGVTAPIRQVDVTGTAVVAAWATDTFTWTGTAQVDILLAVDRSASMYGEIWYLTSAFSSMKAVLDATGLDWHLTATVEDLGCINGDDLWIDATFSDTEARDVLGTMIEWGGYSAYRERAFTLLDAAIDADVPGGCNEGLLRHDATWHLAGMSDAAEQSTGTWKEWVAHFQALRSDPNDIVFDAIGGPYPSGCTGASFYAGMYDAVQATGGTFVSICSTDWSGDLAGWAEDIAASAPGPRLKLSDTPVPGSVEITVDGLATPTGWRLDTATNAIVFDEHAEPAEGAAVVVRYATYGDCP